MVKTSIEEAKKDEYPKLMKSIKDSELIVLFKKYGVGFVVITKDDNYELGYYCSTWHMENFIPFNGKIVWETM